MAGAARSATGSLWRDASQSAPSSAHHVGMAWGIATVVMLLAYADGFGRLAPASSPISARARHRHSKSHFHAGGCQKAECRALSQEDVETLTTNLPQLPASRRSVAKQAKCNMTRATSRFYCSAGMSRLCMRSGAPQTRSGALYNMEDQVHGRA